MYPEFKNIADFINLKFDESKCLSCDAFLLRISQMKDKVIKELDRTLTETNVDLANKLTNFTLTDLDSWATLQQLFKEASQIYPNILEFSAY